MKISYRLACVAATTLLVTACSDLGPNSFAGYHTPESLLDRSSEVVNFELQDGSSLDDLVTWVDQDQPTRAELRCDEGDLNCAEAHEVLKVFGVPSVWTGEGDAMVSLIYDRTLVRDCENRFIDNTVNPYNLTHPSFGCSNATNMLQMVADKRQFTRPALLENGDAARVDRVMRGYNEPYNVTAPNIDPNFEAVLEIDTSSR